MNINVCICTFRRPQLLALLLKSIAGQTWCQTGNSIEIIVVDNDPAHSAFPVLSTWVGTETCKLNFAHVPVANISVARNTALALASKDWIALIDDDEIPAPDWISCLFAAQQAFKADAIFAPVVPHYLPGTPKWIEQGGYFDRTRLTTGTVIDVQNARTGNVLIRAACLRQIPGPFDATFGRTGGEDSLLFRDLLALGCLFVWCDDAPVRESVPLERANIRWLLRRSFRVGQTWIRTELYRLSTRDKLIRGTYLSLRAFIQLLIFSILSLLFLVFSRSIAFKWMRKAVLQIGKMTGITSFQYREYG